MDDIIAIETSGLYQRVRALQIPYHKWYGWLDKRIHEMKEESLKQENEDVLRLKEGTLSQMQ